MKYKINGGMCWVRVKHCCVYQDMVLGKYELWALPLCYARLRPRYFSVLSAALTR